MSSPLVTLPHLTTCVLRCAARSAACLLFAVWFSAVVGCTTRAPKADPVYFPAHTARARVVHIKSFNSLHDLVQVRVGFVELVRGGAVSPHVKTPAGVAYRAGHLYVCDTGMGMVHVWDLATGRARRLGASGDEKLITPVDVAVDDAGTVYVADTGRSEVVAYDASGTRIRCFQSPDGGAYRPVAVAVRDSTLYVADVSAHKVDRFSTANTEHLGAIGRAGSGPGEFYFPSGLAVNDRGELLVSEMLGARVQVFDADHHISSKLGQPGDHYGDLGKPKHLAVGPDNVILIADTEFAHVHLFNRLGQLLMLVGGPHDTPGGTPMPFGVAVAESVPPNIARLVPDDFKADSFFLVTNSIGTKRISLFAVGTSR